MKKYKIPIIIISILIILSCIFIYTFEKSVKNEVKKDLEYTEFNVKSNLINLVPTPNSPASLSKSLFFIKYVENAQIFDYDISRIGTSKFKVSFIVWTMDYTKYPKEKMKELANKCDDIITSATNENWDNFSIQYRKYDSIELTYNPYSPDHVSEYIKKFSKIILDNFNKQYDFLINYNK